MLPEWVPLGVWFFFLVFFFFLSLLVKHLFRLDYSVILLKALKTCHFVAMLLQTKLKAELSSIYFLKSNLLKFFCITSLSILFAVTFFVVQSLCVELLIRKSTELRWWVLFVLSVLDALSWYLFGPLVAYYNRWLQMVMAFYTQTAVMAALRTEFRPSIAICLVLCSSELVAALPVNSQPFASSGV